MGQIIEYIKIAIMNIKHNRGRSVLTMLGIIIGIASVIMVISIGNGVTDSVNTELEGLAGGQVALYVDSTRKDTYVTLNMEDVELLTNRLDHINGASPVLNSWGTVVSPKISIDMNLTGGTPSYYYNSKEPMLKGRYFDQSDYDSGAAVGVITDADAKALFGTTDVVGMTVEGTLWGIAQDITIVGVRSSSSSGLIAMLDGGTVTSVTIEVPLSFMANKFGLNISNIGVIYIYCEGAEYSVEVAKQAVNLLENKYHCKGDNQILMENFADVTDQLGSIMSIITIFISFVAAISLLVGGIGVMNIMLVSVTERTREIGIRKSLGARTNYIMWQFLAEAGIITLIGGVVGIVLGVLGAIGLGSAFDIQASIGAGTVIAASMFSCAIGIFFGIYPAKKAAKLSPIEALRHE